MSRTPMLAGLIWLCAAKTRAPCRSAVSKAVPIATSSSNSVTKWAWAVIGQALWSAWYFTLTF